MGIGKSNSDNQKKYPQFELGTGSSSIDEFQFLLKVSPSQIIELLPYTKAKAGTETWKCIEVTDTDNCRENDCNAKRLPTLVILDFAQSKNLLTF